MNSKLPTFFISHGGGPWPYLKNEMNGAYDVLEASLKAIPKSLAETPRAILMISGHWESSDFAIMAGAHPHMLYDYAGFPPHTYQVQYPAPGHPGLAKELLSLLQASGFPARLDETRGYDHGGFVPLSVMYPEAQIPVVQLSIQRSYDPELHFKLGRVLSPLRDQGILIVGSGLSYHNLRSFGGPVAKRVSAAFDGWLGQTLSGSAPKRTEDLLHWASAPSARLAHPEEDHLVPLFVALGAAEDEPCTRIYYETDFFDGLTVSSYRFGDS